MKPVMMFVAGAILAGTLVMLVMRRGDTPAPVPVAETISPPAPEPSTDPEPPAPAALPDPEPVKPSAMPRQTESKRPSESARHTKTQSKPAPAAPAATSGPVVTAQNAPAPSPPPAPQAETTSPQQQPVVEVQRPEPTPPPQPKTVTIPAGTLLAVRVDETLRSDRNQNGDSFRATLDQPLVIDGMVIAERGSKIEGRIAEVDQGGRVRGVSQMTLELVRLNTSDGQRIKLQTETFARQGDKNVKGDAAKIGVAAGIGAAIGAIAGGGKGAAIGAGVGGAAGAGGVMATRGKAAEIPAETRLSFRLREPVTITEKL